MIWKLYKYCPSVKTQLSGLAQLLKNHNLHKLSFSATIFDYGHSIKLLRFNTKSLITKFSLNLISKYMKEKKV